MHFNLCYKLIKIIKNDANRNEQGIIRRSNPFKKC